ncbi:DUF805 domain-containing protein [Solimonas terrae]|uniref:DUF805 domain-containing protein n=1 Tax=Solimonas terrae TaxID=1396819 RepID=A0A6M2BSL6_9GAMM|nr:DUF805 domain-containing protein [Solimonas terrae]NGY05235.1 DUF805 domain-containing protein [Solimonas terrae]
MNWNWYPDVLQNRYARFDGRAHREEFWTFALVSLLITFGLSIVGGIAHLRILSTLYNLAVLVPSLALGARRLHDTGKSGWLQLIGLIPLIGWIVLIVFFAQPGQSGRNAYGDDPKTATPVPAPGPDAA